MRLHDTGQHVAVYPCIRMRLNLAYTDVYNSQFARVILAQGPC